MGYRRCCTITIGSLVYTLWDKGYIIAQSPAQRDTRLTRGSGQRPRPSGAPTRRSSRIIHLRMTARQPTTHSIRINSCTVRTARWRGGTCAQTMSLRRDRVPSPLAVFDRTLYRRAALPSPLGPRALLAPLGAGAMAPRRRSATAGVRQRGKHGATAQPRVRGLSGQSRAAGRGTACTPSPGHPASRPRLVAWARPGRWPSA